MEILNIYKEALRKLFRGEELEDDLFDSLRTQSSRVGKGSTNLNTVGFIGTTADNIPEGFEDQNITTKGTRKITEEKKVRNKRWDKKIFTEEIDSSVDYTLRKGDTRDDWDHTKLTSFTDGNVLTSIRPDVLEQARGIRGRDGKPLSDGDIASMFRKRILEGDTDELSKDFFYQLKRKSEKVGLDIELSSDAPRETKEAAAIALMDNHKIPLKEQDTAFGKLAPLWKTLYEDLEVRLGIDTESIIDDALYPANDETITLTLSGGDTELIPVYDGDHIKVEGQNGLEPLRLHSERDHAYIVPDYIKNKAIELLGGDPSWKLSSFISYNDGNNIEFSYDTSAEAGIRSEDFYVYKLKRDSVETHPTDESPILKETKAKYTRITDASDIEKAFRYTTNYRILNMEYDDLLLDYAFELAGARGLFLTQQDILFDNDLRDKNSNVYTRQLPWLLVIFPTNKINYNPRKVRSKITLLNSDRIERELTFTQSMDPDRSDSHKEFFVKTRLDHNEGRTGVYGDNDVQARYIELGLNDFSEEGYRDTRPTTRRKTTIRKIKEIVEEILENYHLDREYDTPILLDFDVFSRLSYREFAEFLDSETPEILEPAFRRGDFGARIITPTRNNVNKDTRNTRILYRKVDAPDDVYPVIKAPNNSRDVISFRTPPTGDELYQGIVSPPETL